MTESAYLDAWQKHAAEMEAAGFKKPSMPGAGTVKVGNREVIDTEQNRRQSEKVRNADENVNKNYGSNAQFQMYTLGATKLLSPTQLYGVVREAFDPNYSVSNMANEWLTGQNRGVFQSWDAGEQWAAEHPRLAATINTVADTAFAPAYVFPYHTPDERTLSGQGGQSAGQFLVGGKTPYREIWFRTPTLTPDATKFQNGGTLRKWKKK